MSQSDDDYLINGKPLSTLRVVDLKEELEKRGLSKSGNKKELIEKLRSHFQAERDNPLADSGAPDATNGVAESGTVENQFVKANYSAESKEGIEHDSAVRRQAILSESADDENEATDLSAKKVSSSESPDDESENQSSKAVAEEALNLSQASATSADNVNSSVFNSESQLTATESSLNDTSNEKSNETLPDETVGKDQVINEKTLLVVEPDSVKIEKAEETKIKEELSSPSKAIESVEPETASNEHEKVEIIGKDETSKTISDEKENEPIVESKVDITPKKYVAPVKVSPIKQVDNSISNESLISDDQTAVVTEPEKATLKSDSASSSGTSQDCASSNKKDDEEVKPKEMEVRRLSFHKPSLTRTSSESSQRGDEKKRRWGSSNAAAPNSSAISSDALKELIKTPSKPTPTESKDPGLEDGEIQPKVEQSNASATAANSQLNESGEDKSDSIEKSESASSESVVERPKTPAKNPPSNVLLVTNLTRPFSLPRLKELLSRKGRIFTDKFWIDDIKSKCYAVYESQEIAIESREFIHGLKWPISSTNTLKAEFVLFEELESLLEREKDARDKAAAALVAPESKSKKNEDSSATSKHESKESADSEDKRKSIEDPAAPVERKVQPSKNGVSKIIFVRNLVRPFTLSQLKELLTKFGTIQEDKFWIDRIKSRCYAVYESEDIAQQSRDYIHGLKWPTGSPKTLFSDFANEHELNQCFERDANLEKQNKATEIRASNKQVSPSEERKRKLSDIDSKPYGDSKVAGDHHVQEPKSSEKIREWDRDKIAKNDTNRSQLKRTRDITPSPERKITKNDRQEKAPKKETEQTGMMLDNLFRKTKTLPYIYWLPLSDAEVERRSRLKVHEAGNGRKQDNGDYPKRSEYSSNGRRSSPPPRRNISSPRRNISPRRSPYSRRPLSPRRPSPPPRRSSPPRRYSPPRRNRPPPPSNNRHSFRDRSPIRSRKPRDRSYSPLPPMRPKGGRDRSNSRLRSRSRSYDSYSRSRSRSLPHRSPIGRDSRRYGPH